MHNILQIMTKQILCLGLSLMLLSGCSVETTTSGSEEKANVKGEEQRLEEAHDWLTEDAKKGLLAAIRRQYVQITIINGSLRKIPNIPNPSIVVGEALGAVEATIYPEEYEYVRMDNNYNIDVETKRRIVSPGVLSALEDNRKVLQHLHLNILKPYADLKGKGQTLTVEQVKAMEKAIEVMDIITNDIHVLEQKLVEGANVLEIQEAVSQLNKSQKKLKTIYMPI